MANFFPTQKLFCVVLVILLATELVNSDKQVSFSISKFDAHREDIILEHNANILQTGELQLTDHHDPKEFVGRAFYYKPVPIWDPTTGNVASFFTSFSFSLEQVGPKPAADGFVFFLVPTNASIPSTPAGGLLGAVDGKNAFNRFVGVEFDNFINEWDPKYSHVGIDVNSLISLKTTPWNRENMVKVDVSIVYDSNSKILSVEISDHVGEYGHLYTVAQVVDFKDVLPETVKIGFSASNSGSQKHTIHTWDFTSILKTTTSSTNLNSYVA